MKEKEKILGILIDFVVMVVVISIFHLAVVTVFGLSAKDLLKKGIETSVFQQKMQIVDYLALFYIVLIAGYFFFLRKYFSVGEMLFSKKIESGKKSK